MKTLAQRNRQVARLEDLRKLTLARTKERSRRASVRGGTTSGALLHLCPCGRIFKSNIAFTKHLGACRVVNL